MTDWPALRARFPILESKAYLNNCSCGALSTDVIAALQNFIEGWNDRGADWNHWVERSESVRAIVADLIGASGDEVAVTTSASAGINSVASALDFSGDRNKVVISDFEFPTNGQIWYAQEARGARVERVAETDGYIPVEAFESAIDEQTLIVAITKVCYRNGARLDVQAIAEIAQQKGALVLVDGYQGLGTIDFDVRAANIDFLVGGMVKYLLGTSGIGLLYVREELLQEMSPTSTGWFAQADIFAMDHTRHTPSPTARRFESGTPPVIACCAAEAGLRIIQEVGLANIEERIAELTASMIDEARRAGYALGVPEQPERRGPMVSLRSHDEHRLVSLLEEDGIFTSCRDGNLRVAPHFFNDLADNDALFRALKKHRELLVC